MEENQSVILDENEFYLLFSMLNDRIIHALDAGIPDDHDSSLFRKKLLQKLVPFLRKPAVTLSISVNPLLNRPPNPMLDIVRKKF